MCPKGGSSHSHTGHILDVHSILDVYKIVYIQYASTDLIEKQQ